MEGVEQHKTVKEVADLLDGQIDGDSSLLIKSLSSIEIGEQQTLTFFGHPKYSQFIYSTPQRAIIVDHSFQVDPSKGVTFIKVDNVYEAMSKVANTFSHKNIQKGVSSKSSLGQNVSLGTNVSVGDFTIIEKDCSIDDDVHVGPQVFIGEGVKIGKGSIIYTGVKIMSNVIIGSGCIIYPNAVIGTDGFGHAQIANGFAKISHQGGVVIEDNVEIGSNCCIDQGVINSTIIRQGSKLDNLIQVGHSVEIGAHVAIAAQTGISGSSKIGKGSKIGGQVGIVGHVSIAPNSQIQAQSGVASDIKPEGKKWYGYPALTYFRFLRSYALFKRLPELFKRIRRIEQLYKEK